MTCHPTGIADWWRVLQGAFHYSVPQNTCYGLEFVGGIMLSREHCYSGRAPTLYWTSAPVPVIGNTLTRFLCAISTESPTNWNGSGSAKVCKVWRPISYSVWHVIGAIINSWGDMLSLKFPSFHPKLLLEWWIWWKMLLFAGTFICFIPKVRPTNMTAPFSKHLISVNLDPSRKHKDRHQC